MPMIRKRQLIHGQRVGPANRLGKLSATLSATRVVHPNWVAAVQRRRPARSQRRGHPFESGHRQVPRRLDGNRMEPPV